MVGGKEWTEPGTAADEVVGRDRHRPGERQPCDESADSFVGVYLRGQRCADPAVDGAEPCKESSGTVGRATNGAKAGSGELGQVLVEEIVVCGREPTAGEALGGPGDMPYRDEQSMVGAVDGPQPLSAGCAVYAVLSVPAVCAGRAGIAVPAMGRAATAVSAVAKQQATTTPGAPGAAVGTSTSRGADSAITTTAAIAGEIPAVGGATTAAIAADAPGAARAPTATAVT